MESISQSRVIGKGVLHSQYNAGADRNRELDSLFHPRPVLVGHTGCGVGQSRVQITHSLITCHAWNRLPQQSGHRFPDNNNS